MQCSECGFFEESVLWNKCGLIDQECYLCPHICPYITDDYIVKIDEEALGLTKGENVRLLAFPNEFALQELTESIAGSGFQCHIETYKTAIKALEYRIPKKIITEEWGPDRCPTCKAELSADKGDGYYTHPDFMTMCPCCGQKLDWKGGGRNE